MQNIIWILSLVSVHNLFLAVNVCKYTVRYAHPRKFTKSGSERRNFFLECNYWRTRYQRQRFQLHVGDAPVILANGQRFTMFLRMLFTRLEHIAIIQIDYGITDIVAAIILLHLLATSRWQCYYCQCSK